MAATSRRVGPVSPDTLFAPGDVDAAAKCLRDLADSVPARESLGAELAARFDAEYTIGHHVDRLEALYDDVLAADHRPSPRGSAS